MQSFFSLAKWYALFIEKIPFFVPTQTSLSCCRWGHMAMLQIFVASSSLKIRLIKEIFHHIIEASTRALTFASLSRSLTGDWIEYDVGAGIQRSPHIFIEFSSPTLEIGPSCRIVMIVIIGRLINLLLCILSLYALDCTGSDVL
jgi:hypothetical protein